MFLYSAVSSPLDRSKRFTLFLPWQTCSFRHQLGFFRKHSSDAAITRDDYSLTFPPPSIARYTFIQLSEGRQWRERKCSIFETVAKGGFEPRLTRLRVRHSTELSYRALNVFQFFITWNMNRYTTYKIPICVYCCHNQPKVSNDFFELISSSDAAEKELSSKSKIVFLW